MSNQSEHDTIPHWDLSNVYPGLESDAYAAAFEEVKAKLDDIDHYVLVD